MARTRKQWRLDWPMAWKRPIQLLATVAKTWLALRKRCVLVALWTTQSVFATEYHVACGYVASIET